MRSTVLVLALLTGVDAVAATQPEGIPMGAEPQRVRQPDAATQAYWSTQPGWTSFLDAEGEGWSARFDERTGTPVRMWGPGLDLGSVADAGSASAAVVAFAETHADLLGLTDGELSVRSASYDAGLDAWYVDVDVLRDGLPIRKGGLTFRLKHGQLVLVGAETYPNAPVVNQVVLGAAEAEAAFRANAPAPHADHDVVALEPVLLPEVDGKVRLRAVWEVASSTTTPRAEFRGLVDAETGELVAWWNALAYVSGQLDLVHDTRLGDGETETSPLRNATVEAGGADTVTGEDGSWDLPDATGNDDVVLALTGPRMRLSDDAGSTEIEIFPSTTRLAKADFGDRQAPLTTFHFIQVVQDFAKTIAPDVSWVTYNPRVTVNIAQTCNAWYDGTLNFLQGGGGCNNTGRLADVIFHEWGHGFHDSSLRAGFFDGSLGEGAADTMAFLVTDDSRIAPNFFTNGGGTLRDTDNRKKYPDDYVANQQYIHQNGLIFGGAMWDSREALRSSIGEPDATTTLGRIYAGILKGGVDIENSYDEAVFTDDDDANLGNGTPHQCELVEGFGAHGLGPLGGFGLSPEHDQLPERTLEDADLTWTLDSPAPACIDLTPTGGTLQWRVGRSGTWENQVLSVKGDDLTSTIPLGRLEQGDIVEYVAELRTEDGTDAMSPVQGRIRPHTFHVGEALDVWCNDFETNDGGFRHRLLDGEVTEGADDWWWGEPAGLSGDPARAASGSKVWGNDLGGGEYNGAYQSEKHNRLESGVVDTKHYTGVFLSYSRWLSVEDGYYDQALITADDAVVWTNHGTDEDRGGEHHLDDVWATHVVDLQGEGDDGQVRVGWEIVSDGGLEFGGWTIDDVCIKAPATPDNRLGITDFDATRGDDGVVSLTWTAPEHAPLAEIRVLRLAGAYPTSADDGEVVWSSDDVEVDTPITVTDDGAPGNAYYAVYASDGDDWLSWTVPGWNADTVDPAAVDGLPPEVEEAAGCACNGTPAPASWLWLAGLSLVGLGRRRR